MSFPGLRLKRRDDRLRQLHSDYRKKGFEVVTVSYDKEEDRDKLQKYIKDSGLKLPVYYDGKQAKNEFSPKLNVTSVPRLLVFDQKGILQSIPSGASYTTNVPLNQLEGLTKKLLNIK